ncbi:glycosyltransferase family 1 protein [Bacillus sp. V3B]|uniref:glycosyltransferase family 1 protein n=1 Tax=Bacillus sp. V3B TaxID=2804915 RepID=UPI0021088926|nr:glycosyltransferase family 1 protein [Bacillus sp. V3B]MCQ6275279.1 glycosyltransferase family 1 protein [Bacillus sp. V3B]
MSTISCCIRLGEVPLHLYHITAGFLMLQRQKVISLKIERLKKNDKNRVPYNMMEVIVNEKIRVLYDLNDGYNNLLTDDQNYVEFMDDLLKDFDFCFKRSFSSLYNKELQHKNKIFPLGLNYMVTVNQNISHIPTSNDPNKEKLKKLYRMLPFSEYYNGLYHVESFEDVPVRDKDPNILFMARLWDTKGDKELQISESKSEERAYINEVRAKCIRLCRKEFGNQFFGGVSPSPFSNKYYPDIVIQDSTIMKRNNYLRKVKKSSICIATMGLHESIGWKFGEYVAASKAIVTEELHYEVPGSFENGKNYLTFKTAEDCVEQIYQLLDDDYRYEMKVNNYKYYHQYVRPDRLVLNSLLTIIENGGVKDETNSNRLYAYV